MKNSKCRFGLYITVIVLWGISSPSIAQYNLFYRICLEDIFIIEQELPSIVLGCEMIDCYPGYSGLDFIDWRIQLSGKPIEAITLQFENLPMEQVKQLKIKGNAKWIGDYRLQIDIGETILSGFTGGPEIRPPVAAPRMALSEVEIQKYVETWSKEQKDPQKDIGSIELSVEQLSGRVVINEYNLIYRFKPCFHPVLPHPDLIDLDNNAGNDNAVVLLDGARLLGWCSNDDVYRGNDIISVGLVDSDGPHCKSEIVVFSDDNAMILDTTTNWTNFLGDIEREYLPPLLQVPVTVWLLRAGVQPQEQVDEAQCDIAQAEMLYNNSNCGVGFDAFFRFEDTNQNAVNLVGTDENSLNDDAWLNNLTASAFFTAGQLNVYYVNGAFTGANSRKNRNVIMIGTMANNQTLAHEVGHAFSLDHTNTINTIGTDNVMHAGGTNRTNFTEGQCFRCNVNRPSMLNVNGVRTGPTRNCHDDPHRPTTCPSLDLDVVPN